MNTHTLIHLIQSPEEVKESHVEMLEEEIAHHPYFQAVRVLIAKAKGDSSSIKKAAAYTADRSVLMKIINSDFNPDVNLPNIDHLDIQKDDINAFERLANDGNKEGEDNFKATLEALAEGDEEPAMTKDPDFDNEFGNIDFDVPAYKVDFEEEETTPAANLYNSEEAVKSGYEQTQDATDIATDTEDENPISWPSETETEATDASEEVIDEIIGSDHFSLEENLKPEEDEEEDSIDADLLANIEAARKSRELFMNDGVANDANKEAVTDPLPIAKEEGAAPAPTSASHNPHIIDEEDDEVSDPDLLASLAELRQAKAEAMRIKEEAERRMADMDEDIDDTIEAIVRDEYPEETPIIEEESDFYSAVEDQDSEESIFEEPSYPDPFEESAEIIEKKSETAPTEEKAVVSPPSSVAVSQEKSPVEDADDFGLDSSLFGLDDWLEDDEDNTSNQSSKAMVSTSAKTAQKAQNSQFEHNYTEEDGMTLEEKIKTQSNIISSFIEKKPKIRPDQDGLKNLENDKDLSEESIAQTPTFVSENLASIMVRQGKYGQAINIYKQLILKYPDKKAYFADLIENLENK